MAQSVSIIVSKDVKLTSQLYKAIKQAIKNQISMLQGVTIIYG